MVAEREHVGLEPFFAAGVLTAALSSASFTQTYYASAAAQIIVMILLTMSCHLKEKQSPVPVRIILTAAAVTLGAYCAFNCRIMSCLPHENIGYIAEKISEIGAGLQSAIDAIPFRNPDTNALAKALLSGNRNDLPRDITEAFRSSGASHILALSGLHLGIIYILISKLLCILGNTQHSKTARSLINICFCTTYTLATGASASITRALLFIILREIGELTGRSARLKDLLRKSLLIQLIINPLDILDIGFQLSYAAMAGIAWIYPSLSRFWDDDGANPLLKKIWNSAALSISCQMTTLPLTWHYFRSIPRHFLLTNLIALPMTGIIIPLTATVTLLSYLGACPAFLTAAAEWLLESLVFILKTISGM